MKKYLLMLLAVLGIATAFTSCNNNVDCAPFPTTFYNVWLFADDTNGGDVFEPFVNEDINSNRFDFSAAVTNNDNLRVTDFRNYTDTNLENDDWFFTHVDSGYQIDRKSIRAEIWGWSDHLGELYSEVTFNIFFPKLFGDEELHTVKLQMEYSDNHATSGAPVRATIDDKEVDFDVVEGSEYNNIMLNYTLN